MSFRRRVTVVLLAALVFGAVAALLKGQDPGVNQVLGNMGAPWLVVAFLAGTRSRSLRVGATLGLAATLMALSGFYLAFALSADLGDHGFAGDLYLTLIGYNSRYFLAGLVSGPAFGAIGAWWSARGSAPASIGVGLVLLCEPLAIALIGRVGSLARLAGGWAESDPRPYIGEFLLGLVVLAAGYVMGQLRPRGGDQHLTERGLP
jgi:hypothetical protein